MGLRTVALVAFLLRPLALRVLGDKLPPVVGRRLHGRSGGFLGGVNVHFRCRPVALQRLLWLSHALELTRVWEAFSTAKKNNELLLPARLAGARLLAFCSPWSA